MAVTGRIDGPVIEQRDPHRIPLHLGALSEELKMHADRGTAMIEAHAPVDLRCTSQLDRYLRNPSYCNSYRYQVLLPLLHCGQFLFRARPFVADLLKVEPAHRIEIAIQRSERVVLPGWYGLHPETAIEPRLNRRHRR